MLEKSEQQRIFDTVNKQIHEARQRSWNLLLPSMTVSPTQDSLFVPQLEQVDIDFSEKSKDIYKASNSNGYRLHATALNRIAIAGELKWNHGQTGHFKDTDGSLIFRAVGGVVNSAGNIHQESGYYSLNLEDIRDDLIDNYTEKAAKRRIEDPKSKRKRKMDEKETEDYIKFCVNRDYRQKRAFRMQLCETNAKNRVIRKIFNVKNEYSMDELKRPFLVMKYTIYMDYKDPQVKQMVLAMKVQAALGVYGIQPQQIGMGPQNLGIPAPNTLQPFDAENDPNIMGDNDRLPPDLGDDEFPPDLDDEIPPMDDEPEDAIDMEELDFMNSDDDGKIATLRQLSKAAGIPLDPVRLNPKNSDKWPDLFNYLRSMLTADTVPNDGIPV